jgi:hypothetical protein
MSPKWGICCLIDVSDACHFGRAKEHKATPPPTTEGDPNAGPGRKNSQVKLRRSIIAARFTHELDHLRHHGGLLQKFVSGAVSMDDEEVNPEEEHKTFYREATKNLIVATPSLLDLVG